MAIRVTRQVKFGVQMLARKLGMSESQAAEQALQLLMSQTTVGDSSVWDLSARLEEAEAQVMAQVFPEIAELTPDPDGDLPRAVELVRKALRDADVFEIAAMPEALRTLPERDLLTAVQGNPLMLRERAAEQLRLLRGALRAGEAPTSVWASVRQWLRKAESPDSPDRSSDSET